MSIDEANTTTTIRLARAAEKLLAAASSSMTTGSSDKHQQQHVGKSPLVDPTTLADVSLVVTSAASSSSSLWMLLFSVAMVIGPTVGYLGQIAHVRTHKSADGYSPLVSVILIACNTLRVLYWLGARFATMLLLQSLVMIGVQMFLMVTVLKTALSARLGRIIPASSAHHAATSQHGSGLLSWTPREFTVRYLIFAAVSTLGMSLLLASFPDLVPLVGYAALGIEATLVLPQIQLNFSRKSVAGVSLVLVATWVVGDVVKLMYFVAFEQPEPFIVCGIFQLMCDGIVVMQLWWYRQSQQTPPSSLA